MVALVQQDIDVLCHLNKGNRMVTCSALNLEGGSIEITYSPECFSQDEIARLHLILVNLVDLNRKCKWDIGRIKGQLVLKPANWNITAFYPEGLDMVEPTIRQYYAQFTPRPASIQPVYTEGEEVRCHRCKEGCRH